MKRININTKQAHFIGCWDIENNKLCKDIINFFENNKNLQYQGVTSGGKDFKIKKTIDITVTPNQLENPNFKVLKSYFDELHKCYLDYQDQWPFLKSFLKSVEIPSFNIQKYSSGDHFAKVHTERQSLNTLHRLFAFMTYLNDVDIKDGGQTNFTHYKIKIKPEIGKTLIWPAEWTHAHAGEILKKENKYIVTGWLNFPVSETE